MSKEKNEDSWVICPECKTKLKKENISAHLKHVHDKKIEDVYESSIKVLPKKGQKQKKQMSFSFGTIAIILVILVVIVAAAFFVLSGNSGAPNEKSDNTDWLDDYTPIHSIGTGSDDFWIEFPQDSVNSGQTIDHLNWIVDDLKSKPVLFVVHRTGCGPCTPQANRVIALAEKYEDDVEFHDLDVTGASEDIWKKINDVYKYEVTGSYSIAFTGVFTYVKDNDDVKIGWHSWLYNVEDEVLDSWMKDAIYYHDLNKGKI